MLNHQVSHQLIIIPAQQLTTYFSQAISSLRLVPFVCSMARVVDRKTADVMASRLEILDIPGLV